MNPMHDLTNRLREADPVAREPGLSPQAAADLRRAILAAAHAATIHPVLWGRQLAIAACLTVMVLAGVVVAHRVPSAIREDVPQPAASAGSDQRTQVHFSTPGGTRIVWTLDPAFQLKETLK
jgi:hypothetical protein